MTSAWSTPASVGLRGLPLTRLVAGGAWRAPSIWTAASDRCRAPLGIAATLHRGGWRASRVVGVWGAAATPCVRVWHHARDEVQIGAVPRPTELPALPTGQQGRASRHRPV